jgi:hypothetical protein
MISAMAVKISIAFPKLSRAHKSKLPKSIFKQTQSEQRVFVV